MKPTADNPITPTLRRRLDQAAKATGKPVLQIARTAIKTYLQDMEDAERALAAEKRARSRRPFKEIARDLGLAR